MPPKRSTRNFASWISSFIVEFQFLEVVRFPHHPNLEVDSFYIYIFLIICDAFCFYDDFDDASSLYSSISRAPQNPSEFRHPLVLAPISLFSLAQQLESRDALNPPPWISSPSSSSSFSSSHLSLIVVVVPLEVEVWPIQVHSQITHTMPSSTLQPIQPILDSLLSFDWLLITSHRSFYTL